MQVRIRTIRKAMAAQNVQALLLTHLPDVHYLTGFTGSNAALAITPRKAVLFTDGRYTVQAREEVESARVVIAKKKSAQTMAAAWLEQQQLTSCGIDGTHTTIALLGHLRKAVSGRLRRGFFQPLESPLVAAQREIKDAAEIRRMRQAAALGARLFDHILGFLEPGITEVAVAAELEHQARLLGAEAMSFETIVASGARSALPHGRASSSRIPRKGFITLDFGVILNGYCSDMTRTVHMGRATAEEERAYAAVLEAQESAVAAAKDGVTCGDVDEAARSVLKRAGLARYFTHSTGHGVGLEIHEGPRIAANQKQPLAEGMVVTIEPGVYLPGRFGIRIEDTVVINRNGCEIITPSPKAWIEL
ncbi:aminopeptidase P family protein [Terriglobus albidus]|uniref:Aminopeptidase P family protein n=1 Tax=Terriglobus albidus TaxID=1592106 RepID=A0A5B9EAQ9_9BACT|nr:Xaa-Pro peptidase family protein [Terriglobus albidus]QEE29243.1 aminopeptidase P family protein [Terriglobus albidus]